MATSDSRIPVELSVVVTAHREGPSLLHPALRSVRRALAAAAVRSELIVVLDASDEATRSYLRRQLLAGESLVETDFADPGPARNAGVACASGRWVAFLDGDDLMGDGWLRAALAFARGLQGEAVLYPDYVLGFEARASLMRGRDSTAPDFRPGGMLEFNLWNSVHFLAPRALLLRRPFSAARTVDGWGYEDWHWYGEVLACGVPVRVVPGTVVFYRHKRQGSRDRAAVSAGVLLPPCALLRPAVFPTLPGVETVALRGARGAAPRIRRWLRRVRPLAERALPGGLHLARACRRWQEARRRRGWPAWLLEEWRRIHELEPALFPERRLLGTLDPYAPPEPALGRAYARLCRAAAGVPEGGVLFLVPWIVRGGADRVVLNYVRLQAEQRGPGAVAVLATEDRPSPWASRLPPGVTFIQAGPVLAGLSPEQRETLLTRLWLQLAPEAVHVVNAALAYAVLRRHGRALTGRARVFACAFCPDFTAEGQLRGYPFEYLPGLLDQLAGVFCDNRRVVDQLVDTYAVVPRRFAVHPQPVALAPTRPRKPRDSTGKLRVLWAARLDRQKRPDVLLRIVEACRDLPVEFTVHGEALLDRDDWSGPLARHARVRLAGPFDGLESLPLEQHDLFLHTAQWEGLPNTLLEAAAAGLPVLAAEVGGVAELIRAGETGWLASPCDEPEAYVRAIREILAAPAELDRRAAAARLVVSEQHSWARFRQAVAAVPGYLPGNTPVRGVEDSGLGCPTQVQLVA